MVDRRCEVLGRTRRGSQDHQVGAPLGGDEQLVRHPGKSRLESGRLTGSRRTVTAFPRYGVHELTGGIANLHRTDLDQVTGQRRLTDNEAGLREQIREFGLRAHRLPAEQVDDALLPCGLRRRYGDTHASKLLASSHESRAF